MAKQVVESYETLTPGGDGTSFVHPGAEMGGTSKDGAEESMNKKRPREDDENSMIRVETQVPSDNEDEKADRLTNSQWLKRISNKKYIYMKRSRRDASKRSGLEGDDNNDSGSCHNLASIRDETVPLPEIEQRNEDGDETGQKAGRTLVLSLSDGNNFSSPPLDIAVSPPETMQSCDDELDVHGNNADESTTIADDSMEPDYLLHEPDGAIAGVYGDKTETNESGSQAAEINIPIPFDENKSSDPLLASEGASEDRRTKAHKSMGLSSSDKSNTHLNVGDQTLGQDYLSQDNGLGSEEETMRPKEQLEDLEKSNGGGGIGNDSVKQSLLNIEEMAKDIEERIMKAQKNVAWLKARKAMKQRNITSARLGR
ncbi:unnamed protein product [Eruca vesicaria subsp. sativa]|uniref:Uncharacterized protein n=1 Tax=Eruca vesicaria subsp. sativa TaxID=29727 RepID=A0ABC8K5V4_ERUVS|nr:unnamed protein product [Eruca vesicaria subsp. sativa]